MNFSIREGNKQDNEIIARLILNMIIEIQFMENNLIEDQERALSDMRKSLESKIPDKKNFIYLIAETLDIGEILGIGEASIRSYGAAFNHRKILHIHSIYVLPNYRRNGIGNAIMRKLSDWGKSHHCQSLELGVTKTNPARDLYQQLGFEVNKYLMKKDIV